MNVPSFLRWIDVAHWPGTDGSGAFGRLDVRDRHAEELVARVTVVLARHAVDFDESKRLDVVEPARMRRLVKGNRQRKSRPQP
jgi:hypothetical protein